ncbi:MAG: hypothetical protein K9J06_02130 [Flavobacteriales bacterium]|nr:hypothetical protein [Flavobacteriales bacterium]
MALHLQHLLAQRQVVEFGHGDAQLGTQFLAGAEAYSVCLIYYKILEAAAKAGMPGADERYNRLKERFVQLSESEDTPPPTDEKPDPTIPPIPVP